MKQLQQGQYTGKGGIYQQLTFPISENILIDEHEPVYVANAQLEELDYRKLYQAYSPRGRKSAAEPRIMFKLLVYGYMCGIYSTRKLELACRKNIDFIWLLEGEHVPDYSSFARFRSGKAKEAIEDLFCQFVKRLAELQETEYDEVFIDGTKMENMTPLEYEDGFLCAGGRKLLFARSSSKKEKGFITTTDYYRCQNCSGCPLREKCFKSSDPDKNKEIRICRESAEHRKAAFERLATEHGTLLRMNRSTSTP